MSKNIVYCSDGTWNGPATRTNVSILYDMLVNDGVTQCAIYDQGVGRTGGFLKRLSGGAFGDGLVDNIRKGYASIARVHERRDRLSLFGFSRGAYTARSLAGMIAYCGLPVDGDTELVELAFDAYRSRVPGEPWTARPRELVDAHIEMIGVWDTVGAMGIPGAVFGNQDAEEYRFRNKALHPDVRAGYHAIAIDERRRQFKPTLWDAPAPNQIIEQVWFAGVHGDVGGGKRVRRSSLSEITLAWMVDKAVAHRIQLSSEADYPHLLMSKASADCPMRTSWRPYWGRPAHRSIPQGATIANSVAARMSANRRYRPEMLIDPMTRTLGRGYPLADVVAISPTTSIPLTPDLERTAS